MKRIAMIGFVLSGLGLGALGGCDKPSEDECRKALANIRALRGTESPTDDVNAGVRRCKGGSSRKAVECAIAAKTVEELDQCEFMKKKPGDEKPGDEKKSEGDDK